MKFVLALCSAFLFVSEAQRQQPNFRPNDFQRSPQQRQPLEFRGDEQQFQKPQQRQQQEFRRDDEQFQRPHQQEQQLKTTPIPFIPIIRFDKEQSADGSYKTSYETGNNIIAEETGFVKNIGVKDAEALVQHGSYTYTSPDGQIITVQYTADEQGFRAEGAHLPTPPPVPAEIQKSLDIIYAQIEQQKQQDAKEQKFQKLQPEENNSFEENGNFPRRFRQ